LQATGTASITVAHQRRAIANSQGDPPEDTAKSLVLTGGDADSTQPGLYHPGRADQWPHGGFSPATGALVYT
jgi:hypothetical protein